MKLISLKSMKKSRKVALLAGMFFAATSILGGTAYAASTVVLTAGTLSIAAPTVGNFTGVTLDGTAKTTTATMDAFGVIDARGSGAGWNVTVQATQFTSGAKTLALSSVSMPAPTASKVASTSGNLPTVATGPYLIDSASAVKIATAAADGSGMGSYAFTGSTLTLSLPASVYAGTYTSTVTVSVVTGP